MYEKFTIYATLIIGVLEVVLYRSMGDEVRGVPISLDRIELFFVLIIQLIALYMAYPIFKRTKDLNIKFHHGRRYKLEIDQRKIHWFMIILLLFNLYGTIRFGNATVGKTVSTSFSFIFNIIQVRPIFFIYFVCARDVKKPLYWTNLLLYAVYRILCGWTSDIMVLIILEFYLRIKYNKSGVIVQTFLKMNDLLVAAGFVFGSWLYCYAQPFKESIRYGRPLGSIPVLSYLDGVSMLISRFTNYPVSVVAIQKHDIIARLYQTQGKPLWEIEAILAPLLPRFIMPNKDFRTFGNLIFVSYIPTYENTSTSGYNIFVYWFNILEANWVCFILGLFVLISLWIVTKKILYAFDDGSNDVDILYFMFVFGILQGGTLSSTFGYGYIALVYTIPILMCLGIIHLRRENLERESRRRMIRMKTSHVRLKVW